MKRTILICLLALLLVSCEFKETGKKEKIVGKDVTSYKYGTAYHNIYTESGHSKEVTGSQYYQYKIGDSIFVSRTDIVIK